MENAEKTILIAGKEMPEAKNLADGFKNSERNAFAVGQDNVLWNKSSAISSRSFVLQCANKADGFSEAVLYFDEGFVCSKFPENDIQTCTQICCEYILGYQYLTAELLKHFEKQGGKIAFIYAPLPKTAAFVNPSVKAAASAFISFAKSTAERCTSGASTAVVLVKADREDRYKDDASISEWLGRYFDEIDSPQKKPDAKRPAVWIKPGSKPPFVFPLFPR
ncbi:hypothetical protein HRI96_01760 [Treponema parvum]|uniref:Uncharacterized protein n=1 Tax=Treponema parvum TaxID=138851 RepID=A0A975IBH5_9SPIR|nr:hypothetical protein [Treponema parvum]QTQ11026.1 hypothetical protein HRI96_01760 [Treponema parvum]QTQ17029.1 hypothetical protein HXT04_10165 [Treponema parvum]